jgi:hypothetical protein
LRISKHTLSSYVKLKKVMSDPIQYPYEVGDRIYITKKPKYWNAFLNGLSPMDLIWPMEGVVREIDMVEECVNVEISGDIYGFDLEWLMRVSIILL